MISSIAASTDENPFCTVSLVEALFCISGVLFCTVKLRNLNRLNAPGGDVSADNFCACICVGPTLCRAVRHLRLVTDVSGGEVASVKLNRFGMFFVMEGLNEGEGGDVGDVDGLDESEGGNIGDVEGGDGAVGWGDDCALW